MRYYCTLFDSFYLSRGLLMHESLEEWSSSYHLFIFAFDDLSWSILSHLKLKNVTVVPLSEFENKELKEVKGNRSKAEYCWTSTPSVLWHLIKIKGLPEFTYVDADLIFWSDPSVLTDELVSSGGNVLVTEHRFSILAKLHGEKKAGRFCVQFMTFTNEENSLKVLERWKNQCIEWCYARYEDGKFGDQKYLDEWPDIYDNVHILQNHGGGVAPWNVTNYSFSGDGNIINGRLKSSGSEFKVVFYHYQYVKIIGDDSFDIGWYIIPEDIRELFYTVYAINIAKKEQFLHDLFPEYSTGYFRYGGKGIKERVKSFLKEQLGYNVLKINK